MKHLNWIIFILLVLTISTNNWAQTLKNIRVKTKYGKLYGELITCKNKKNAPIVVIIPESGPTDRNGNSALSQTNNYKMLSEGLANEGISSLRYDKLLVGESKGRISEADLRFDHNIEFVSAWLDYLNSRGFNNIVIVGHGEGSLIGMLAAQSNTVSKYISLGGIGRTIDAVLTEQLSEKPPKVQSELERLFKHLRNGDRVENISPELAGMFRTRVQPYLISWIKYNPVEEISNLEIPVLIIHGSNDIQVSTMDARMQKGGNSRAQLIIIDGMNHILKPSSHNEEENTKTYFKPNLPLHPELIPAIVGFVK